VPGELSWHFQISGMPGVESWHFQSWPFVNNLGYTKRSKGYQLNIKKQKEFRVKGKKKLKKSFLFKIFAVLLFFYCSCHERISWSIVTKSTSHHKSTVAKGNFGRVGNLRKFLLGLSKDYKAKMFQSKVGWG
jgi:hypothetical protein